jgi:hypothetical protein
MLSKTTLIDHIQQINRSARYDWLVMFDIDALKRYLDHLQFGLEPRDGQSRWARTGETPAVLTGRLGV